MSRTPTSGTAAPISSGCWREHRADQQAAVRAAVDHDVVGRVHSDDASQRAQPAKSSKTFCFCVALAGVVPLLAELAAAAQVRDDEQPAALDPDQPARVERRRHRDVEPAVAVEQGRYVAAGS